MAFTWTEDLGPAQGNAALEDDYRKAIVAAVNHLEGLRDKGELPSFSGGSFASASNSAAKAMEAVVMAGVAARGIPRAQVLTLAIRVAEQAFYAGAGDATKAAAAIKAMMPQQQQAPRFRSTRL